MNFSLCRPVKILLLGAGGTGGYVAPHLYRLMHTLNRTVRINIVDGDLVEAKNLVRQNFCAADLGENKAKVLATRYSEAFGMETLYHPTFLEKDEELYRMIQPGDIWLDGKRVPELSILIGCVDNNKSRQMCHRVFERSSHLVYIDSGNDEFSGQVVCGIRCNRRTIYKPVCKLYPDMLEETDKFPSKLSCAEAAVSAPQSITANIMAATVVTDFVYNIVARGKLTTRYAVFSAASINVRAESNKKRQRRTAYLCAPGVNAIKYLPSAIRSLSVERLLGEYDMDQIRQEQYSAALRRMQDTLKPLGIPYIQQMWNPAYNGIDDYKLHSRWLPLAA